MTRKLDRRARTALLLAMSGAMVSAGPVTTSTSVTDAAAPASRPATNPASAGTQPISAAAPGVDPAPVVTPAPTGTQPSSAPAPGDGPAPAVATTAPAGTQPTSAPASGINPASVATTAPAGTQPASTRPVTLQVPASEPAGGPASRPGTKISLNFKDASIESVLHYLSEAAGFIVVEEAPVEGRVTVVSRRPVSGEEALTLLNAVLKTNGFTAIQQGRVLKIVSRDKAKKLNIPVHFGAEADSIPETDELITQVIPIKNVDAVKLRQDLQPLISSDADFAANQGSNSLILTDTSADIRRVVNIIEKLDQQEGITSSIEIKQLKFANASSAAKLITSVFAPDQVPNAPGQQGGPGAFFRRMMMGPGGPGGPGGANGQQDTGARAAGRVTASADDRTNTIVVVAPPDTLKLVDRILLSLDSDSSATSEVRIFQLQFADAASAAKLINTVFEPDDSAKLGPDLQRQFQFQRRMANLQNISTESQTARVNAAAADRSNTLVVTAPPDTMKLIADILKALDADPAAMSEVKVFQLKYADSASAAKLLQTIFTPDDSTNSQPQQNNNNQRARLPQIGGLSAHGGRVIAASDDRTNTLVVTAPSDAMKIVSGILKELDSNPQAESALFIYHLRNGVATDIQTTLMSLFSAGGTGTGINNNNNNNNRNAGQSLLSSGLGNSSGFGSSNRGGNGLFGGGGSSSFGAPLTSTNTNNNRASSPNGQGIANSGLSARATSELVGQVMVVADSDTNSLLVSTASRYQEQVKKIIEELDRPVPQVLIKVLVAEVTHERTNDFGPDFSILDTRASGKGVTVGQALGNAAAASSGGLVVSVMETNLNAMLHALATQSKLDVLSRPYILASDNQQASITVGQEVPFITNTQITDTGQQINTIQYQAIGIILNVTPHISPDGLVVLDVQPEISALTGQTIPIGNNVTAPVIANRSAQSRVAIRNGNTIVIGGLMQDQKTTTINKLPLLGDIPYLGAIFSRYQDDRQKTELLIFLTPHLAQQPDQLPGMSQDEMRGTKLTPHAVEPGTFDDHMQGMQRGATVHETSTKPPATDIKPTPSTQPFGGITISAPGSPQEKP